SDRLLNELRLGVTRRGVVRAAARLDGPPSDILGLPGIPSAAQCADPLPPCLSAGYQQIGSPPNTASDFSTGVIEIADTLTWPRGRHTIKAGADLRGGRLDAVH